MKRFPVALLVMVALIPAIVSAQDKAGETRKFGLTIPNIGLIWHITDNVAFVPDITFIHNWSTFGSDSTLYKHSGNGVAVNAALRLYIQDWKGIRFYVTPKYGFSRSSSSSESQSGSGSSGINTHSVTGAWGLQYAVTDRISLFGDIGARYSRGKSESIDSVISEGRTTNNNFGTVGTWGLIVYLK